MPENPTGDTNGIYVSHDLSISGTGELEILVGSAKNNSYAIAAGKSVNIFSGNIWATAGDANNGSYGLFAETVLNISGGSIWATAGNANYYSYAIAADEYNHATALNIYGGSIVATAGESDYCSYGVSVQSFTIHDGSIWATAGKGNSGKFTYSSGVSVDSINIFGGSIVTTGAEAFDTSRGVSTRAFVMSGGSIVATAGNANYYSYGVGAGETIEISGGSFIAKSGRAVDSQALSNVPSITGEGAKVKVGESDSSCRDWSGLPSELTDSQYVNIQFESTPPSPPPVPSPSSSGDSSRDSSTSYTTGVVASGSINGSIDVFVLTPSATGTANEVVDSTTYNQLRQSVESGYTPVAAFEVQASHSGKLTLSFPVGEQYNGMQFVVKHKTSKGIETYTGTVQNGKVVITVDSLSPFMIAVKGANKNPNTGR